MSNVKHISELVTAVYAGFEIRTAPGHSGEYSGTFNVTDKNIFYADAFKMIMHLS